MERVRVEGEPGYDIFEAEVLDRDKYPDGTILLVKDDQGHFHAVAQKNTYEV